MDAPKIFHGHFQVAISCQHVRLLDAEGHRGALLNKLLLAVDAEPAFEFIFNFELPFHMVVFD